ncbi:MAG: hypothetical protein ACLUIQ_05295 [Dialister invisus]
MKRRWTETFSVCMRGSMVLSRMFKIGGRKEITTLVERRCRRGQEISMKRLWI